MAEGAEKLGSGVLQANQFFNASSADQATNNLVDDGTTLLHGDPNKVNADGTHDTGLYGKQGQDYMDAYGAARQQLHDLVTNHRENLPSGQAQLEYDRNSRRWLQIQEAEMGRAYDGAQKTWMVNNNTVSAKQALDDISRNPGDDKAFGGYLDNLKTAYGKTAQIHGLGDAGNAGATRDATRDAWKVRLEAISVTDPSRAEKLANDNAGVLGTEAPVLIDKYKRAAQTADVASGVHEAISANMGKPTSELASAVQGRAPNDPNATYASWPKGAVAYNPKTGKALFPATMNADGSPAPPVQTGPGVASDNAAGAADIARREGAGYDPGSYHARTVGVELGGAPLTTTNASGHMGPVQASPGWWNEFGAGGSPFNLNDSIAALDRETARNQPILTGVLGREPGEAELYLAHQQGIGGAAALLSRPDANVIDALAPAYKGNRASAMQAVLANGGNVNMTAGQFSRMWTDRYNGASPSAIGHGQTMTLPASVSGSAPASPTDAVGEAGLPQAAQPATFTASDAAAPLDAAPEPETPEEKLERLTLAKDASLQYALERHPEWNDAQQREAARQVELEFQRFTIATQMDAHTRKVHKDALGDKVAGFMLNGQPDQAFSMIHDPSNGLTNTERLSMSNAVERQVGKSDPATLGPAYGDFLKRVLAPAGSEDRIGIGDADKVFQGVGQGLTMRGAKEILSTVQSIQKSVDEYGNQKMIDVALARAKDKLLHEEDIGTYHVRDEHGVTVLEQFTNKFLTDFQKYREKGYDPKGFNLFDPAEADKVMDNLYPLRQRLMNRMGAAAGAPQSDQMLPAPAGIDAKAWTGLMTTPPIIDNGTKIVPHQIWGKALGMLLRDQSPQMIAAFDNSVLGKAAGNDAAMLIEGLTGRAAALNQYEPGGGIEPPRAASPPRALSPEDRKMLDVGGAVRSLFHVGEAHPLTETPAERALRYGVGDRQ